MRRRLPDVPQGGLLLLLPAIERVQVLHGRLQYEQLQRNDPDRQMPRNLPEHAVRLLKPAAQRFN
jgi:hypothetical protein